MATYHWRGRGPGGHEVEGDMAAPSKDEALQRLRAERVLVTDVVLRSAAPAALESAATQASEPGEAASRPLQEIVRQGARQPSHPIRGLLVSAVFVLAALLIGAMAPVVVCDCAPESDGRVACVITERDLGVVPLRRQSLTGVVSAEVEVRHSSEARGQSRVSTTQSRLVLGDNLGNSVRPRTWEGSSAFGASVSTMRDAVEDLIRAPLPGRVSLWQGHWVPLLLSALCLLIAILMFVAAVLAMTLRSRRWVYDRVGALAAEADRRGTQQ